MHLDPALGWLGATLAVEVIVALALRSVVGARASGDLALGVVGVNLVSFPLALIATRHGANWGTVEIGVVAVEAVLYRVVFGPTVGRPLLLAVATNVPTAALGVLVAR